MSTLVQPYVVAPEGWMEVKDGNHNARAIFDRHYSRRRYADGRKPLLFIGPGEKFVLMMADGAAVCAWRKFINDGGQTGVNCAIFRREHGELASEQLKSAMALAWQKWPGERLYTYVDPREVPPTFRASRPTWGHCFYQAGWTYVGLTNDRKHILECLPKVDADDPAEERA